jgi:hypothetical protein
MTHAIETDNVLHFGYLLAALSVVHGESLSGIVRPPYDERLSEWFDGEHGTEFLNGHLPERITGLLTARFLDDFAAGRQEPAWFYTALGAATTSDFAPRAPMRIHYGSKDDIVIPKEAHTAFERMTNAGGNVELLDVGPYGHDDIVLHTAVPLQQWFDALERERSR